MKGNGYGVKSNGVWQGSERLSGDDLDDVCQSRSIECLRKTTESAGNVKVREWVRP